MRPMIMLCSLTLSLLLFAATGTGWAQDGGDDDHAQRVTLAQEMHKIRPARMQVQEAVDQVSRNLPPMDRDRFIRMVDKAFDYDTLEKLSVDAMVELFTVQELQKMVDYFGSDEAQAIEKKLPVYQEKIQPYIIKSLDAAIILDRTGGAADPALAAPADAEGDADKEDTVKTTP